MGEFDGMGQGGAVYYLASWPLNKMYMLSLAVSAVCVCPDLMVDHSNLPTFPFHFFPSIQCFHAQGRNPDVKILFIEKT